MTLPISHIGLKLSIRTVLLIALLSFTISFQRCDGITKTEIIGDWAESFGEELWELGKRITKAPEIKARYKALHVRVEEKDGKSLLRSAVETVGLMLSRKMDAIRCIQVVAESLVEQSSFNESYSNFTYYSSKFSPVEGEPAPKLPISYQDDKKMYTSMSLNADTHFYNISVNTSCSTVHVPTNVYDQSLVVADVITWSEELNDVFIQNYNSDPALFWQYFCSSTGIMRQYPAVAWDQQTLADMFDCRRRSWYIEAATCSKDVVILFDNSGSMNGYSNFVATFTVKAILETFSNNDFFNIFAFANDTVEVVPCFSDKLMQATPDNIRTFNEALKGLKLEGSSNFTIAFTKAFELLESYRITRGCNDSTQSPGCNQVIMLVTDGVPGNLTEVYEKYNRLNNGTDIPVRIFTYLIGKEVTNVREIQWLACLNRGYYVHIQSLDEVQAMVLKYISVIARPLVLQNEKHPISWTHAYTDITPSKKDPKAKYEKYRLMTAAAIPLYDKKANKNNETKIANLLGVVGTDVPIEEIDKLTLPYKLGVNGYSFIVSNNGYLLLHPDLRPVYKGILKENYNSVDVVEVETMDDELGIHELGKEVLALREAMVGDSEDSMMNVKVRFHYDKMRRISRERQDYYFAPLPNTPFSLGIVLPHDYGNTWIKVGDEIRRNQHLGLKVEDFFTGDNWKVHPNWVYCKYHYLEGHEYNTSEEELLHFLHKMGEPDWKWSEQYEKEVKTEDDNDDDGEFDPDLQCGRKTQDDDAYFCNRELVQLLVFDAKVTEPLYKTWEFKDFEEEQLFRRYNASLRFVATMSGLTRWQFVFGEDVNDTTWEFGDYYNEAIDEIWYKSAILQHQIEAESFVFSVPFDSSSKNPDEIVITASHAVFPRDGGKQAPAAVMGYQFSQRLLYDRFMEITTKAKHCDNCELSCASEHQDCYVLDNSGYIILSEDHNDTGRFFGEVEGPIMEAMVKADIFQKVNVFDLQGVCFHQVMKSSDSSILATPFHVAYTVLKWLGLQIAWLLMETHLSYLWADSKAYSFHVEDDDDYYNSYDMIGEEVTKKSEHVTQKPRRHHKGSDAEEEEFFSRPQEPIWVTENFACDRLADLFVLQQHRFMGRDTFSYSDPASLFKPHYVTRIPNSNLIMVVVESLNPTKELKMHAGARPLLPKGLNGAGDSCHKTQLADLPRRRLEGCYTYDPAEAEIEACGKGGFVQTSGYMILLSFMILFFRKFVV